MNSPTNNHEYQSTGILLFDRQNKELLEAVFKLEMEIFSGKMNVDHTFRKNICRIIRLIEKYFDEQEKWMLETGLSECRIQKKSRAYFVQEIEKATAELECSMERACELTCFLKNWLLSHIRSINKNLLLHAGKKDLSDCGHNKFEIIRSGFMPLTKCSGGISFSSGSL